MPMNYYMMTGDGRRIGPVAAEELLNLGLTRDSMVWREDFSGWTPARQVPELICLLNSVPPCPPGPGSFNQSRNRSYEPAHKPDNYMVWAILSTVMCCIPLGIVSIVYSSKVDSLWYNGEYEEAEKAAAKAKNWALASLISAVILVALYIFIYFFIFAVVSSSAVDL